MIENKKWENIQVILGDSVIQGIEPIIYNTQKRIPRKLKKKYKKGYLKGTIQIIKFENEVSEEQRQQISEAMEKLKSPN